MKKEKKKGSCLKTVLIVFGVLIVLCVIGAVFGDDENGKNDNVKNIEYIENTSALIDENEQLNGSEEAEDSKASSEMIPDVPTETDSTKEDPLGFNVMFSSTYRNDVTGNWRLAKIAENISIENYAVDYYNNYFESDNEVHVIVNFTLNTTTRITVMGNLLDVSVMEYVDKEEHDAKLACSGMLLSEYHVNIDTGEIEKIQ